MCSQTYLMVAGDLSHRDPNHRLRQNLGALLGRQNDEAGFGSLQPQLLGMPELIQVGTPERPVFPLSFHRPLVHNKEFNKNTHWYKFLYH